MAAHQMSRSTRPETKRNNIINSLEIHPVSAPELRKILADDEDDRSFLTNIDQTGIPDYRLLLKNLLKMNLKYVPMQLMKLAEDWRQH